MKEYKLETVIITKGAWKWLQNKDREEAGCKTLPDEILERMWSKKPFKNGGANPKTHPIQENEVRLDKFSTRFSIEQIKKMLTDNGFEYRQDGFESECLA